MISDVLSFRVMKGIKKFFIILQKEMKSYVQMKFISYQSTSQIWRLLIINSDKRDENVKIQNKQVICTSSDLLRILFWLHRYTIVSKISYLSWYLKYLKLISDVYFSFLFTLTCLKNKIENNLTWEKGFYQSEWVKKNSSWIAFIFSF